MSEDQIKMPTFETIAEASEWAETHDTAPYFDSMEDEPPFELDGNWHRRTRISIFLNEDALVKLRTLASERALDYHTLAEAIILERLATEP
jgi:hypothetical protein